MTPRRRLLVAAGAVLLVAGALLGWQALVADRALHRAEDRLPLLRTAVLDGDDAKAAALLEQVQHDAARAAGATDGPLWAAAAHLPLLGGSAREARVVARSVDLLVHRVAPPLLEGVATLRPALQGSGLALDPEVLRDAGRQLDAALARLEPVAGTLERRPAGRLLPPVGRARTDLGAEVRSLHQALRGLAAAPALLGADGPRRYFVGFQNNAESRGTGGLLGAYAVVVADRGRLTVERLGSDLDLEDLPVPRVDLGADYRMLYGPDARLWQNTNMSAHFPYAARQWVDMWQRHTGQRLDGALATDPVALSYLLGATGPLRLPDGQQITEDDVVADTEQQAYLRYADDDLARKDHLVAVARTVLDRLLGHEAVPRAGLAAALARAAEERRLLLWSAHPDEQALLAGGALAGEVPDQPGPFAFLVVNNAAGNKADYYLRRALTYDVGACHSRRRSSTLTVVLRNDVPASAQPRFVTGRLDGGAAAAQPGASAVLVSVLVARGAQLRGATLDGLPASVLSRQERGHPVYALTVELPRATPRTLVLTLLEPGVPGAAVVPEQPLASAQATVVRQAGC